MDVINITIPFDHHGVHYCGLTVHAGVDLDFVDAPCGAARKIVTFANCADAPQGLFFDAVSSVSTSELSSPFYLQLYAGE